MRILIVFLFVLLFTGCGVKPNIEGEISEIKYNDTYIVSSDYNKIKNMVSNHTYLNGEEELKNSLVIKTDKDIYSFKLSDDFISYNGKMTKDSEINKYLQDLTKKYHDRDFYEINYVKDFEDGDNEIISLDKTSNYIVIKFNEKVTNFKINEILNDGDDYSDVDLLYSKESVNKDVIIRKSIDYKEPDIRISFTNEYGFRFSIIPRYNDDKLEFVTTVKQEV